MRRAVVFLALVLSLSGCAGLGKLSPEGTSKALSQAQGALTALDTLAKTASLTDETKSQIAGYAKWANVALQAAGVLAPVVVSAASGS